MVARRARSHRGIAGAVALLIGGLAGAAPAGASLLVYEPFDYAPGTVLDGVPATGENLSGSYLAEAPAAFLRLAAASPGLDFGSLGGVPGVAGGRLTQPDGVSSARATVSVDEDVLVGPGAAIFWSALFRFDDSSNGNRFASITLADEPGGDEISFGESVVGVRALRLSANTAATGQLVTDSADGAFENGQVLLLVGRYVNGAAPGSDRLDLLVYDTADAETPSPTFDPADPAAERVFSLSDLDIDLSRIGSIAFSIRGDDDNFIDELRIGTSYASVLVPEPASAGMLALGILGLGLGAAARGRRTAPAGRRA